MIEKTPIVGQVRQIAKCASLSAARAISRERQCRGAASSSSRKQTVDRHPDPSAIRDKLAIHQLMRVYARQSPPFAREGSA